MSDVIADFSRKAKSLQTYIFSCWTVLLLLKIGQYCTNQEDATSSFCFSRQGFSVALEPVLELALVDQAGLELTEIRVPLPPECWD